MSPPLIETVKGRFVCDGRTVGFNVMLLVCKIINFSNRMKILGFYHILACWVFHILAVLLLLVI